MIRKCGNLRQATQIQRCGKRGMGQIQKTLIQLRQSPRSPRAVRRCEAPTQSWPHPHVDPQPLIIPH